MAEGINCTVAARCCCLQHIRMHLEAAISSKGNMYAGIQLPNTAFVAVAITIARSACCACCLPCWHESSTSRQERQHTQDAALQMATATATSA
jgi:hypothetical protein